jgi:hypothetical protein
VFDLYISFTYALLGINRVNLREWFPGAQLDRKPVPVNKRTFGRAIAQAVSRWLPTAAARVQTRV